MAALASQVEMKGVLFPGLEMNANVKQFLHAGRPVFNALSKKDDMHPVEKIGAQLRQMMPWIGR